MWSRMDFKAFKTGWVLTVGALVVGGVLFAVAAVVALLDGRRPPPPSKWPLPPRA